MLIINMYIFQQGSLGVQFQQVCFHILLHASSSMNVCRISPAKWPAGADPCLIPSSVGVTYLLREYLAVHI